MAPGIPALLSAINICVKRLVFKETEALIAGEHNREFGFIHGVFIVQLVEHCSANTETKGSNPVQA